MAVSPAGKRYIGITYRGLHYQRRQHEWRARHLCKTVFQKALKAHKFKFEWSVLDTCPNRVAARIKEVEYIRQFNTTDPDFGYNQTEGSGAPGYKHSVVFHTLHQYRNLVRRVVELEDDLEAEAADDTLDGIQVADKAISEITQGLQDVKDLLLQVKRYKQIMLRELALREEQKDRRTVLIRSYKKEISMCLRVLRESDAAHKAEKNKKIKHLEDLRSKRLLERRKAVKRYRLLKKNSKIN